MEKIINFLPWPVIALLVMLVLLGAIHVICKSLIPQHVEYVRNVWYFYFLIAVLTMLVGLFCIHIGVIDAKGKFHGPVGDVLNQVLKFLFALKEDVMLAAGAVALILGPQFASYLFSGLVSGCAVRPRHTGIVFKFVTFSLAKSFVTVAGLLLGLGALGWAAEWEGMAGKQAVGVIGFSGIALTLAFYILLSIAEVESISKVPHTSKMAARWAKIDGWMKRNAN
jgi:hypothetical protein